MSNALAVYDGTAIAEQQIGALAIEPGQTQWTPMQQAAFGQLGIADAPDGDRMVFLHVSQRTGLDPFARQIYMIGRREKKNVRHGGQWTEEWSTKWGIQTGIEGFRVIRARAERAEGVRGILSRPLYYNGKGERFDVWVSQGVPVAVEMTYTVRDRNGIETPYVSILRFDEYRQTRKETRDGVEQQVLSGQWATKPTHMLEKCTEADVYRKAFPQDYSGVQLDDAMPPPDPDALEQMATETQRRRITADAIRARQPVTAEVVTEDVPPAAPEAAPSSGSRPTAPPSSAEEAAAGGTPRRPQPASTGQVGMIRKKFAELYPGEETDTERLERLAQTKILAGRAEPLGSTTELTSQEAVRVRKALDRVKTAADLEALIESGEAPDEPA